MDLLPSDSHQPSLFTAASRASGKALWFLTLDSWGPAESLQEGRRPGGQRQTNRETEMETGRQKAAGLGKGPLLHQDRVLHFVFLNFFS